MASIDVPCANQECDSEDIELIKSEDFLQGFKHRMKCNVCNTTFSLVTCLDDVKIPKGVVKIKNLSKV